MVTLAGKTSTATDPWWLTKMLDILFLLRNPGLQIWCPSSYSEIRACRYGVRLPAPKPGLANLVSVFLLRNPGLQIWCPSSYSETRGCRFGVRLPTPKPGLADLVSVFLLQNPGLQIWYLSLFGPSHALFLHLLTMP